MTPKLEPIRVKKVVASRDGCVITFSRPWARFWGRLPGQWYNSTTSLAYSRTMRLRGVYRLSQVLELLEKAPKLLHPDLYDINPEEIDLTVKQAAGERFYFSATRNIPRPLKTSKTRTYATKELQQCVEIEPNPSATLIRF